MLMLYAETSIRKCMPLVNLIEDELNQPLYEDLFEKSTLWHKSRIF